MAGTECPFCNLPPERVFLSAQHTLAFPDAYPVTEGHTIVIPKRHVGSIFDLTESEQAELWVQVAVARSLLAKKYVLAGFNVGFNDGTAAGQTIEHAHIHIIPRRKGDVADPKGGIRWVIPGKAKYW